MNTFSPAACQYSGSQLLQIAMPIGGLGAGCICLNGSGALQDLSLRHKPATTSRPDTHVPEDTGFALLRVSNETTGASVTKLLEGPIPFEKIYDQGLQTQGYRHGGHEGMPRFERCSFESQYPFGRVNLEDSQIPLEVTITGWNPFIPLDDVNSGLPCAILEYTLHNPTSAPVDFEFSYHLSHLAAPKGYGQEIRQWQLENTPIENSELGGGVCFRNSCPAQSPLFGSAAVFLVGGRPKIKANWFRGGWFDTFSVLWREVAEGNFVSNQGGTFANDMRSGGSVWVSHSLAANETLTLPIVIAWHFPNPGIAYGQNTGHCLQGWISGEVPPELAWRPFYAGKFADAEAVALHVAQNYESLRARTWKFASLLWESTLPPEAIDAIASNLAILKSPTVLRQENGNVWAWEGCFTEFGCCHGTCTHVWNYAQAMPHLFPSLERTLREQELVRSINDVGKVSFRAALPDGETAFNFHAAADGQLGGILKLWREYHIGGDKEWLRTLFPAAKKSLDYCITTWDPDRRGALFEPHHNTYDIEFWGPESMTGTLYVAALSALADFADILGEEATGYRELAQRGAQFLDAELFNGEYYHQKVQWEGLRDTSFVDTLNKADLNEERWKFGKTEGPRYQYGTGVLSDGVIGAWMALLYGIETPLNRSHVRATLDAIFRCNFKNDLSNHVCLQRPGYALGHEPGLLLCTWPHGGKPTLPFVYSDEVWTGIEYQVASHLILEGFVEEGLTIVRGVRSRYDGHKRNPFNEYECGSYYARAMASYALLPALTGFRYDGVNQILSLGPQVKQEHAFRTFFSTAKGFGSIELTNETLAIELAEGELSISSIALTHENTTRELPWNTIIHAGQRAELNLIAPL